jgi:beta-barrel assembly-enhancing protease
MPSARVIALVLSLVAAESACATRVAIPPLRGGQYLLVERMDFPEGTARGATATVPGSQLLIDAATLIWGLDDFLRANGIPDAIALEEYNNYTHALLAYLPRSSVFVFSGRLKPSIRPLLDADLDQIDPDRRVASTVQQWSRFIAAQNRIVRVGRRLVLALQPSGAARGGSYYGFILATSTRDTRLALGAPANVDGDIVGWVDSSGPAANLLQQGDVVTAIDGVPVTTTGNNRLGTGEVLTLSVVSRGTSRQVAIVPEAWPRQVHIQAVVDDAPNAFAGGGAIVVTTGFTESFPSEDVLAVAIGHELAHLTLEHDVEVISAGSVIKDVLLVGVVTPISIFVPIRPLVDGFASRFNRAQERDADRLALHYAKAAGYDPQAALVLVDALEQRNPSGGLAEFFDIHPPFAERRNLIVAELSRFETSHGSAANGDGRVPATLETH